MQLTGDRFTQETASFGNDLSTLPNFPAEIRAPQGTLPGVSSFQVHFADHDILTPGDSPDVLVAMNPAALRANLGDLKKGATVIVDSHDFTTRNLTKAGYAENPLENDSLAAYDVHAFELTDMTVEAVREFGLSRKDVGPRWCWGCRAGAATRCAPRWVGPDARRRAPRPPVRR